MKITGQKKIGLLILVTLFTSVTVTPTFADDTIEDFLTMSSDDWLLSEAQTFRESEYCWSKGEKPVLQVKQGNGKWKSTNLVPKFSRDSSCERKNPYQVSFRITPKKVGIQTSSKGAIGMSLRVRSKIGEVSSTSKKTVYASEQDFINLRAEVLS